VGLAAGRSDSDADGAARKGGYGLPAGGLVVGFTSANNVRRGRAFYADTLLWVSQRESVHEKFSSGLIIVIVFQR
jgi:hypothetical protein